MEKKMEKTDIVVHFDEEGNIEIATKKDGTPLKYHKDERKHIHKSQTRIATNDYQWEFKNVSIVLHFDEQGYIEFATQLDGSPLVYGTSGTKQIPNSGARLRTPNDCCWRDLGGWRCRPEYC